MMNEKMFALFAFNPFPNTPFLDCPKFKEAADDNWNVCKIEIAKKTLWKKVKLLIWAISPFFTMFSKSRFIRCVKMSIYGGKG